MTENIDQLVTHVLDLAVKSAPRRQAVDEDAPTFDEHLSAAQPNENDGAFLDKPTLQEAASRQTDSDGREHDLEASSYDQVVDQGDQEDSQQQSDTIFDADSSEFASESAAAAGVATEPIVASSTTNDMVLKGNETGASDSPPPSDKGLMETPSNLGEPIANSRTSSKADGAPRNAAAEALPVGDVATGGDAQPLAIDDSAGPQEVRPQPDATALPNDLHAATAESKSNHRLEQAVPQPTENGVVAPENVGVAGPASERAATTKQDQPQAKSRGPVEPRATAANGQHVAADELTAAATNNSAEANSGDDAQIPVAPGAPPQDRTTRATAKKQSGEDSEGDRNLTKQAANGRIEASQAKTPTEPVAIEATTTSIDTSVRATHDVTPQPSTIAPASTSLADRAPLSLEPPATHSTRGRIHITEAQRDRFLQRVAGAFQNAQRSDGEVRIRLHPPELGALRMQIKVDDGQLVARLETETHTARKLLLDNLPALRDRLAGQEIRIERFDVDVQDQSSGHRQQQAASRDHGNGQGQDRSESRAPNGRSDKNERGEQDSQNEVKSITQQPTDSGLNVVI